MELGFTICKSYPTGYQSVTTIPFHSISKKKAAKPGAVLQASRPFFTSPSELTTEVMLSDLRTIMPHFVGNLSQCIITGHSVVLQFIHSSRSVPQKQKKPLSTAVYVRCRGGFFTMGLLAVVGYDLDPAMSKNHRFGEFAQKYLEYCINQQDYVNKKSIVKMLIAEFGNLPLNSFTLDLVERYQAKILMAKVTPTTANRKIAVLKNMFTKACDWNLVSESVCKAVHKVKLFKVDNTRTRFLSDTEIRDLYEACDYLRPLRRGEMEKNTRQHLKAIITVALNTGCRREEILSLRWEQVDMKHGFINLIKTKNTEKRSIKINDTLWETLSGLVRRINVPWVFYNPDTGNRYREVTHSFKTVCKRAGIADFRFHDLRHTFASHLVMAGVDLTTVSRLMGHKSLAMTLRYAHLAPDHVSNAVNLLNGTMNPTSTKLAQCTNKKGLAV